MNILQVHAYWDVESPGGVITVMRELADGLGRRGHRGVILAGEWDCPRLTYRQGAQGPYYCRRLRPVPKRIWNLKAWAGFLAGLPATLRDLRRLCRQESIDLIHLHYPFPYQFVFALLRLSGGPPYIVTFHLGDAWRFRENGPLQQTSLKFLFRRAAKVTAVSHWLADLVETNVTGIGRPAVIYNGMSMPAFDPEAPLPPDLPVNESASFAVMVGVLRPYKGLDVGIRAWHALHESGVEMPLLIFGDGPQREELNDLIASLGMTDRVHLLGHRPRADVLHIISRAELLVAPSRRESFGLMVLESLLCGTLVVCSDIGPFHEILGEHAARLTAPVDDAAALAGQIRSLLAHPEHMAKIRDDLKKDAGDRFSLERMVDGYLTLYADACGRDRRAEG